MLKWKIEKQKRKEAEKKKQKVFHLGGFTPDTPKFLITKDEYDVRKPRFKFLKLIHHLENVTS